MRAGEGVGSKDEEVKEERWFAAETTVASGAEVEVEAKEEAREVDEDRENDDEGLLTTLATFTFLCKPLESSLLSCACADWDCE